MKRLLLLLSALLLLFTGCANPTVSRIHHPLDMPEKSKTEIVKYEGVTPKTISRSISYESRTEADTTLFTSRRFCYDPQNDYVVIPNVQDSIVGSFLYSDSLNKGLYRVIPKDSITICKGDFKNNSYFSRNHALHGLGMGALCGGMFGGLVGIGGGAIFILTGGDWGAFILISAGVSAAIGAPIGLVAEGVANSGKPVDDVEYRCDAYYSEGELLDFLNKNRCY